MNNHKKKLILNMVSGLITRFIILFIGLIFPKLFIETFGSEVNGLVASITQVFSYLLLLEAGVGAATLQSLYKPVAADDFLKVNNILSASKDYYNKVSIFYFIGVVVVSIGYPLTIVSSISNLQITLITLTSGLASFIRFQNYQVRLNLLKAEGKEYIVNYFVNGTSIIIYVIKIILLLNGFSILAVQAVDFIVTLVQAVILNIYFKLVYEQVNFKGTPDNESLNQSGSVMVHQISGLIFNSTDIIILTYFTNFSVVSVYTLYNTISNAVNMIASQVSNSFTFLIGQTMSRDKERFLKIFDIYELVYLSFSFTLATTMYLLLSPFLSIYTTGFENNTIYLDNLLVILFSIRLILLIGRTPFRQLIDTAGHFKNTRRQSIFESVLNILFSIVLVINFGIYGVLIGTIIALVYRTGEMIFYTNKYILTRSPLYNFSKWVLHLSLFIVIILINLNNTFDFLQINGIVNFVIAALSTFLIVMLLYFLLNLIFYSKVTLDALKLGKQRIFKK